MLRKGKFQVLQFSSTMKIISLKVEVTNVPSGGKLGEDAHQAMLNITIPEALRYSGVRSKVRPSEGSRRLKDIHLIVISSVQVLNPFTSITKIHCWIVNTQFEYSACACRTMTCNALWTPQ